MGEERLRRLTDRVRQLRARFLTRRQKWKVRQTDRVRQLRAHFLIRKQRWKVRLTG